MDCPLLSSRRLEMPRRERTEAPTNTYFYVRVQPVVTCGELGTDTGIDRSVLATVVSGAWEQSTVDLRLRRFTRYIVPGMWTNPRKQAQRCCPSFDRRTHSANIC